MNTGGRGKGREVKPETMAQQSAFLKKCTDVITRDGRTISNPVRTRTRGRVFREGGSSPLQPSQRTFLKDNLFSFFCAIFL